ncbi:hypothetical protein J7T55_003933 [Diaporthe amygdali]|uniref:uncharacterized protein n=1 Tax=Phomopsis amygdali TaxID=1214568 RepID=UPI0022FE06E0|nr:uncharacterized protein J7T55_003933 [Diaporthe amygdali]KAJ0117516.1 hypothetical protein J7T55_003933 [Diaporthe amygdali]
MAKTGDYLNVRFKAGYDGKPYNSFQIRRTFKRILNAAGIVQEETTKTLVDKESMGLNGALVRKPCLLCKLRLKKAIANKPSSSFKLCGHQITKSIRDFNNANKDNGKCQKLVYVLRHGEADHNVWKKVFGVLRWTKDPEYKRQPIFTYEGQEYCIIDPPLTKRGVQQADDANAKLLQLKKQGFMMPKRAFVSLLYRTMMTFEHALAGIGIPSGKAHVLDELLEQRTGNGPDILLREYTRAKNPIEPPPPTKGGAHGYEWIETDENLDRDERMTTDEIMRARVERLHNAIFDMDDSDCIILVTHSLLIQHALKSMVDGNANVLKDFMLDEGGLFAYVVEGKRTGPGAAADELKRKKIKLVSEWKEEMGPRRESAFSDREAPQRPAPVRIEDTIMAKHTKPTNPTKADSTSQSLPPPTAQVERALPAAPQPLAATQAPSPRSGRSRGSASTKSTVQHVGRSGNTTSRVGSTTTNKNSNRNMSAVPHEKSSTGERRGKTARGTQSDSRK